MTGHQFCPHCERRRKFRRLEYALWALLAANVVAFSVFDVAAILNDDCAQAKHDAGGEKVAGKHALPIHDRLRGDDEGANQAAHPERVVPVFVGIHAGILTSASSESIA